MSFTLGDGITLKNKLGANDPDELEAKEEGRIKFRFLEIDSGKGPQQTFDKAHLQNLHQHLFQDVYEWAGELRHKTFTFEDGTTASMPTMQKIGGKGFAEGAMVELRLDKLMSEIKDQNFLKGLDRETFADRAAEKFAELNSIHPFREGNGRTQREFFHALAENAGHTLDFNVVSQERMTVASIEAHERGDVSGFKRLFQEISDPKRVACLEKAQNALERFSPVQQTGRASKWDHIYIATTEAGQEYSGKLAGIAGDSFMMQTSKEDILIGRTEDLPDPPPKSGSEISFTASPWNDVDQLSQSADDMLNDLSVRLADTDDLGEQRAHLDDFIKTAKEIGGEDHLELARKAELYKQRLDRGQERDLGRSESEQPPEQNSRRASRDDGYGL